MFNPVFADSETLVLGALTGLIFGFLLQKGGLTRYQVIVGQFLLRDFTMLKVMFSAIVVGSIGIYGMLQMGMIGALHVKGTAVLANVAGGLIFGAGMAVIGYCPGTGMAAIGDGSRHAIPGVLGMLFGAAVYAEAYPWLKTHILPVGDMGRITLATQSGWSPWVWIALLSVVAATIMAALEIWQDGRKPTKPDSAPPQGTAHPA